MQVWHNLHVTLWFARVRIESDKIVAKVRLSPKFGTCAGGNSENGAGNIFPMHYKECSLGYAQASLLRFQN